MIMIFAIILALSLSTYAHNGTEVLMHPFDTTLTDDPVIDGDDDDWDWWYWFGDGPIETVNLWQSEDYVDNPNDFRAQYRLAVGHGGELMIFARVYDDTLKQEIEAEHSWDKGQWWKDDSIWIYIDADHSGGPSWRSGGEEWEGNTYAMAFRPLLDPLSDWNSISPFIGFYSWGPLDHWASQEEYTEFASKIDTLEDGKLTYTYEIRTQLFNKFDFYSPGAS